MNSFSSRFHKKDDIFLAYCFCLVKGAVTSKIPTGVFSLGHSKRNWLGVSDSISPGSEQTSVNYRELRKLSTSAKTVTRISPVTAFEPKTDYTETLNDRIRRSQTTPKCGAEAGLNSQIICLTETNSAISVEFSILIASFKLLFKPTNIVALSDLTV